jgi:hypothetical protein
VSSYGVTEERLCLARKRHPCNWCGIRIQPGEKQISYSVFGCEGSPYRMHMHPECHAAMGRAVEQTGDTEFEPYGYTRGCTCEGGDRGHGHYPTCDTTIVPKWTEPITPA